MDCQEYKEEKSTIVSLCGINYRATHRSSSSINNRFLLFLAQIKYFIICFFKKLVFCIRKVLQPIFHHVMSNYGEVVIFIWSMSMTIGILYTFMAIIIDILIVGVGLEPAKKDDDQFNHLASHPPNAGLLDLIITHIIVYAFRLVVVMVSSVVIIYCLSHIAILIKKIMDFIINVIIIRIKDYIVKFYFKIPEVEPVDPLDIV